MPTVAITDFNFPDLEIERAILSGSDIRLVHGQCKSPEEVAALCRDADAVITQFAPVNALAIEAMSAARVIVRYGIGFDNVDTQTAYRRMIPVCNIPDYCIDEVADHTLAFILSLTRQVIPNHLHVQQGHWGLATSLSHLKTLRDLTIGCVGFGRIGREVLSRLGPFKCRRLVYDPMVEANRIQEFGCEATSLLGLLEQSDIVTLHCPSTDETRRMINVDSLRSMKSGSLLVNLGRGDLVDPSALMEALDTKHLAGAALDVFTPEPLPLDHPFRKMHNLVTASHIASASPKAVRTLRESAARIAALALNHQPLPNIVNGVKNA